MKKYLIFSILLNIFFLGMWRWSSWETNVERKERMRVDKLRVEDFKVLEHLLVDRIDKKGTLEIFKAKLKADDYFEKPSESGIGAGTMFLVFGENDVLKKIEITSFDEK